MSFYEEIAANKRMTYFLFIIFFLFILALGLVFGLALGYGYWLVPLFVFIAIIYILFSYYNSDKMVLAVSKAKPADPDKFRVFHNIAEEMALAGGVPKPKLYVIEDTAMNAFATGRNPEHSVICATTGLLAKMNREELQGVIAHEMSHIKNQDIKVMTIAAVLVGIAVLLSDFFLRMVFWGSITGRGGNRRDGGGITIVFLLIGILLAILTPVVAYIIKFAISRKREYLADASGAMLSRYPQGLASALEKLKGDKEVLEAANKATAHMYIANPLKGQKLWMKSMFATHPPIDERIARLKKM